MSREASAPAPVRGRTWMRRIATLVGLGLLAAALVVLWRQREVLGAAFAALGRPDPRLVALLLLAVVANIVLTGLLFSVLLAPHGRVPLLEMQALIAGATLANYLPLRPGLFGRVVYHRAVHGIPAVRTGGVVVAALVLTSVLAAVLAGVAALTRWAGLPLWIGVMLPLPLIGLASVRPDARRWCLAGLLRYADVLVWALRYDVAFRLIGAPISADAALALACVSVVTMLVPIASNGLGLREWAIGLFAPFLSPHSLELGLTADVVNRAAELAVVLAVGGPALVWLTGRLRRVSAPACQPPPPRPGRAP